jgi:hypothetical protein
MLVGLTEESPNFLRAKPGFRILKLGRAKIPPPVPLLFARPRFSRRFPCRSRAASTSAATRAGGRPIGINLKNLTCYVRPINFFTCLFPSLKLLPLTTFLPVFSSSSCRAFFATLPPFLAGILFSSKPFARKVSAI